MTKLKSSQYLPKNLRSLPLYQLFTELLDYTIDTWFTPLVESNRNIYNPYSKHYDADYIINLLGGKKILPLLDDKISKDSLSILLPKILDIKGTEDGLVAILKILKVRYKSFILLRDRNNCGKLIIILETGVTIDLPTLQLLEELITQFLPQCVQLIAITNCYSAKDQLGLDNPDEWDINVGAHKLDVNFRTDRSLLSRGEGYFDQKSRIHILLCVKEFTYLDFSSDPIYLDIYESNSKVRADIVNLVESGKELDRNLTLSAEQILSSPFVVSASTR